MEKPWLKDYPAGVPAEIDPLQYPSLAHVLEDAFRKHGARRALACMGRFLTYGEVEILSRHLAAWLQSLALPAGARIALMMPNVLQYPVSIAAVLRAGYVVVNVNPLYTPRELAHQLNDSGAQAIIVLENFAATLQAALADTPVRHIVVASLGDLSGGIRGWLTNFVVRRIKRLVPAWTLPGCVGFNAALRAGAALPFEPPAVGPDDLAFLQYTGGTTGVSKGAMLRHRNLVANVLQSEAWMQPALDKPGRDGRGLARDEALITITALPLYHIFALTICGLLSIRQGGLAVLIPNPRDIPGLIKVLRQFRFHLFPAVNTLYNALLNHPEFARVDCSSLRVANGGGMAVQEAVANAWLAMTGCPIIEGYGLSETSPSALCNRTDTDVFSGTVGLPIPSTEVVIRDDAGRDLPAGQVGEVCIRGPQVMAGYWNRPDETAQAMCADGFFKTGDLGVMNERGYTRIVDRKKDMILVSGFNVYPNEIEGVAAMCPGVLEVAAVGVPDAHSGEAVKLFVVSRDAMLTDATLMTFCKERLTPYKCPKFIEFCDALPKTNVGKILRRALRDGATPPRA